MKIRIVNRNSLIGGKIFRFEIFKSPFCKGFKIVFWKTEFRFYFIK